MKIFILITIICLCFPIKGDIKEYLSVFDKVNQKIEIDIEIINFDNNHNLNGTFYKSNNSMYIFDNNDFRIIIEDSIITTVNKISKQVIKDKTQNDEVSLFSLVSGDFKNFNISKESVSSNKLNLIFKHNSKDISGVLCFKEQSNLPDYINMNSGSDTSIMMKILNISKIQSIPYLDFNNYEIINLNE